MAHLKIVERLKEHFATRERLSSPGTQSVDRKHSLLSEYMLFVVFVHLGDVDKMTSATPRQTQLKAICGEIATSGLPPIVRGHAEAGGVPEGCT